MISETALAQPLFEHCSGGGDLRNRRETAPVTFTNPTFFPALLCLRMFDRILTTSSCSDSISRHLLVQESKTSGPTGGDGHIVKPSAAEPSDGALPGDKVAGLACAGQVSGRLSPVGRGIHPRGTTYNRLGRPSYRLCSEPSAPSAYGRFHILKSRSTAISTSLAFMLCFLITNLRDVSRKSRARKRTTRPKSRRKNKRDVSPILADEPVVEVASRVGPSVVQLNVKAVHQTARNRGGDKERCDLPLRRLYRYCQPCRRRSHRRERSLR